MKGNTIVSVDRNGGSGRNAIIFFALAIVFRSLGIIQRATDLLANKYSLFAELVLPLAFCALMVLCIVLFGKNHFWLSVLPMVIGVLFFILRGISEDNILAQKPGDWSTAIHICVYLLVLALYSCAVLRFSVLKWVLIPVYILGSVYHIISEDYPALVGGANLSFSSVMNELSILFVVLGLIFTAFAIRTASAEESGRTPEKKNTEKKQGLIARLFSKKSKEPEQKPNEADTTVQKQEMPQEKEAPAEETPAAPKEESPVFDESFFDQPYTATLTLDPQPDSVENSDPAAPEA